MYNPIYSPYPAHRLSTYKSALNKFLTLRERKQELQWSPTLMEPQLPGPGAKGAWCTVGNNMASQKEFQACPIQMVLNMQACRKLGDITRVNIFVFFSLFHTSSPHQVYYILISCWLPLGNSAEGSNENWRTLLLTHWINSESIL
jgi:hypothetical protein